jgi:hypothetical protein
MKSRLTQFDTIVTKEESRQNHLSHAQLRAESGEEAHRHDTKQVNEDDRKETIHETKVEDWDCQNTNSE